MSDCTRVLQAYPYDREGVATKVKIEQSSYKDVTYRYKVIVDGIDGTEIAGIFILCTNVKCKVGDTVSVGGADANAVAVHGNMFCRMDD